VLCQSIAAHVVCSLVVIVIVVVIKIDNESGQQFVVLWAVGCDDKQQE